MSPPSLGLGFLAHPACVDPLSTLVAAKGKGLVDGAAVTPVSLARYQCVGKRGMSIAFAISWFHISIIAYDKRKGPGCPGPDRMVCYYAKDSDGFTGLFQPTSHRPTQG